MKKVEHRTTQEAIDNGTESLNHGLASISKKLSSYFDHGHQVLGEARDLTVARAKVTDNAIRGNPYPAIGLAFGFGILLTLLVKRK